MNEQFQAQLIGHNGKGRGSRLIAWATRGSISHVSIRFQNIPVDLRNNIFHELGIRLEADHEFESIQGRGVQCMPFIASANQSWYNTVVKHDGQQAEAMLRFMVSKLGKKYDWRGIFSFASRRSKQNPNKWFCSELTAAAFSEAGISVMNMPFHWIQPNIHCASPAFTCIRKATA